MNGKPDIDLYFGGQFTVGGNAPMETGLFNLYVSESNPGRLLNTCEAMTADSINCYFSVDSEKWYFITPLHDVDLTKVTVSNGASYVFRYYDGSSRATNGTGNSWRNVDNGKLTAGQGYIFRCNANAVVSFPAEASVHAQVFNTDDVIIALNAFEAAASANKSWNFVGNPYPCYYDIYYMDFTAPITVWTGSTYKAYSIVDDNFVLRPMQSFFVQKPDAVDNIVFHKEGRQLTTSINHDAALARAFRTPAKATTAVSRRFFNLQMIGDEMEDETRLVINDNASLGYEIERDASKFMSFEPNVPQIFTLDGEGNGLLLSDILGTEEDLVFRHLEEDVDILCLRQALSKLPQREKEIVVMRYGLEGRRELTQKEVAQHMGISQSYISRLEKRIMVRLRKELDRLTGCA